MSKRTQYLRYLSAKLQAEEDNRDTFIDRIERSNRSMVFSQFRTGGAPPSKYENHGHIERNPSPGQLSKERERYAMS